MGLEYFESAVRTSAPDPGPKTAAPQKKTRKVSLSEIRQQAVPRKAQGQLLLYLCQHTQRRPKIIGTTGAACDGHSPRRDVTKERGRRNNAALLVIHPQPSRAFEKIHQKHFQKTQHSGASDRPSLEEKENTKTAQSLFCSTLLLWPP